MAPYKATFIFYSVLRTLRFTVLAMMPFAIGRIINAFETGTAFDAPEKFALMLATFIAVYGVFLLSVIVFTREAVTEDRMIRGLTLFSVRHMNALPLGWHEAQGSGSKIQRIITARNALKSLYSLYKWHFMRLAGSLVGIILSVVFIQAPPYFLLLYLGFVTSFCASALYLARPLSALHNRHNILLEKLMAGVYEFVSAVRTVKAFHMGDYIQRQAHRFEGEGHAAMHDVFKITYMKWTILNAIGLFWIVVFLIVCSAGVYQEWLTIGAFATCFFLANELWHTLEQTVYIQDEFYEYRNGLMRLTETLKEPPQSLDIEPAHNLPSDWQSISFEAVDFSYRDQDLPALHNIKLRIKRGEKVALVGKSGAGKSTLVKLLMKQMWLETGKITVDDLDLKQVSSEEWLNNIGFVPQDVELFNMTIRDNILLDRVDIAEDLYKDVLKQAALEEFIADLPEGDQTMVGERGIKLSGGQKQRLGIARALVRQAALIIFDEATSSLDSLSERAIQDAIERSFAGKTLLVIAHRLSTVRYTDRIILLEGGRIAEEGTFDELLAKEGRFAALWTLQSEGFSEENVAVAY